VLDAGADGVTGLGAAVVARELELPGRTEERGDPRRWRCSRRPSEVLERSRNNDLHIPGLNAVAPISHTTGGMIPARLNRAPTPKGRSRKSVESAGAAATSCIRQMLERA